MATSSFSSGWTGRALSGKGVQPRAVGVARGALAAVAACAIGLAGQPAAAQCENITILSSPDTLNFDQFGAAVAISGNYAVVGAPGHYTGSTPTGALYIYTNTSGAWTLQQEIADPATTQNIGRHVAIVGSTIIAGSDAAARVTI